MEIFEQLKTWLSELLYRTNDIEDHFVIKPDEEGILVYFFTRDNRYQIIALKQNYLGCQVSSRKPRAGEDWTRGNDLSDGKFNKETWNKIKNDIISYELVKVAKKEREVGEEENII